jgi:eukaryotic-like serine/threonine-protein kinase
MTERPAAGTIRRMLKRATNPAPSELDVESAVRDRLYGERREVTAMPVRRGKPAALGGRYRLLDRLGTGGTADVYRARDERLQRDVAAKVIAHWLAHDMAAVRCFRREAALCARLAHPNIAGVLDAGTRPRDYIIVELVDGRDAATLLKQDESLSTEHAIQVVAAICDALEHAHARGVVHCDVAPRNILIGERDGVAKLVDFGLAADLFGTRQPAQEMGTPGYVAPEVIRGAAASPQSDLYSLAAVAYRLLGGLPPFGRRDDDGTAPRPSAIAERPTLAAIRPDLPSPLAAAVDDAMAQRPAARPASVAEFRRRMLATARESVQLRAA